MNNVLVYRVLKADGGSKCLVEYMTLVVRGIHQPLQPLTELREAGRQAGSQNVGTSINKGFARDMCCNNKGPLFLHSVYLKEIPL